MAKLCGYTSCFTSLLLAGALKTHTCILMVFFELELGSPVNTYGHVDPVSKPTDTFPGQA